MKIAFMYKNTSISNESCSFDYGNLMSEKDFIDKNLSTENVQVINVNEIMKLITSFKGTIFIQDGLPLQSLLLLKSWTRKSSGNKLLITFDTRTLPPSTVSRIRACADGVIRVESFGPRVKPYPDFDGVINIIKIPKINSINTNSKIDTLDIGFQWKSNRYFVIDKLSLPPDVSETASRTSTNSCAAVGGGKNLEF